MIERVARQLCRCEGYPEDLRYDGQPMWANYAINARQVLAAMRDPTKAMLDAGGSTAEQWSRMLEAALFEVEDSCAS